MSDELIDHSTFEFDFPVWTVVDREKHRERGLPSSAFPLELPDPPVCLFLQFTDEDLARQFIEGSGSTRWEAVRVPDKKQFIALLRELSLIGFTHVGVDCSPLRGAFKSERSAPIADVIARLERES